MKNIYLDNSATTAVAPEVRQAMDNIYANVFGNPSSIHTFGQEAKKVVDDGRRIVGEFVGAEPEEIIFTSGGSESDNLAIRGLLEYQVSSIKYKGKPHIITSAIEHHAVLYTIKELEKEGKIEATYVAPQKDGVVAVEDIEKAIRPNTILISVMYVNNEVGTIQPIQEIGAMIEKINLQGNKKQETCLTVIDSEVAQTRGVGTARNKQISDSKIKNSKLSTFNLQLSTSNENRIYFHCDAVQGAEFLDMKVDTLKVDLLTFTAHKIHGPKGIGVLYIRKGTPIKSQVVGGSQEFGKRAGTENVAGIAGLAEAIQQVSSIKYKVASIGKLRDKLENFILKNIPETYRNGDKEKRAPHIANISFKNAEGEAIILNLDFLGIAVSSGSACTSRSLEPSHVLSAMGVPPEKAHGSIRFSLSKYTTEAEIDRVIEVLPNIISKLRQMSPFK